MKTYEEMAARVLERRDEHIKTRRAFHTTERRIATFLICAVVVGVATLGVWSAVMPEETEPVYMGDKVLPGQPGYIPEANGLTEPNIKSGDTFDPASNPNFDPSGGPTNAIDSPYASAPPSAIPTFGSIEVEDPGVGEKENFTIGDIVDLIEGPHTGLCEPTFIAYRGALYGSSDTARGLPPETRLHRNGDVYFNGNYRYAAYTVEGMDEIGIIINGGFRTYAKVWDFTFEIDGVEYGIKFSPVMDGDYAIKLRETTSGNGHHDHDRNCDHEDTTLEECTVFSNKDFTVYEAERIQGEPATETEYLVHIAPTLIRELPNLFDDGGDHAEFWWIAVPLDTIK